MTDYKETRVVGINIWAEGRCVEISLDSKGGKQSFVVDEKAPVFNYFSGHLSIAPLSIQSDGLKDNSEAKRTLNLGEAPNLEYGSFHHDNAATKVACIKIEKLGIV